MRPAGAILAVWAVTVAAAGAAEIAATVRTGAKPVFGSTVTLYAAGNARGSAASMLGAGLTDAAGRVRIVYAPPSTSHVLYLLADGAPTPAVRLATVLGPESEIPTNVIVNELTTMAAAYALSPFLKNGVISGATQSLQLAAGTAGRLVSPAKGEVAPLLAGQPARAMFNTMANLLASCVQMKEAESCRDLFAETRAPNTAMPVNTLDAAVAIARYPARNVVALYLLAPRNQPYSPALSGSPDAWSLTIEYAGTAAGNLAIDRDGNVWLASAGGLTRLHPSGETVAAGSEAHGANPGIGIDPLGRVWVTNRESGSVSVFDGSGKSISPAEGYRAGRIRKPQGTQADACGNVWIANNGGGNVTKIPKGDPARAVSGDDLGMRGPSGVAVDGAGNIWVTGSDNNRIAKFDRDGKPAPGSPFILKGLDKPVAIAADTLGNAWVANQEGRSIAMVRPDGQELRHFTGGGIDAPVGIAVDGSDNIFVANSKRPAMSMVCGARTVNCPLGMQTGEAISPATGYAAHGLSRLTGIAIDAGGNVWVAGSEGVVAFVGLASPVATPLIGPPRMPGQPLAACAP